MKTITLKYEGGEAPAPHGPEVIVEEGTAAYDVFLSLGYAPTSKEGEGAPLKPTKHLSQMNKAELDDYAAHLGVEFPENVNTNPEKAAFIKTHLEPGNA